MATAAAGAHSSAQNSSLLAGQLLRGGPMTWMELTLDTTDMVRGFEAHCALFPLNAQSGRGGR